MDNANPPNLAANLLGYLALNERLMDNGSPVKPISPSQFVENDINLLLIRNHDRSP
jgi:hypothetical protein